MRIFDENIDQDILETGLEIDVGKKKPAIVTAQLASNEIYDILPKNIGVFDKAVLNGVCTIRDAGNASFTLNELCRVIAGKNRITKTLQKNVEKSIQKMQTTLLKLDWTAHADLQHLKYTEITKNGKTIVLQPVKTEEAILRIRKETILMNGCQPIDGYILEKTPALWEYAKAVKQIACTNIEMLEVDCNVTPENIVLRNELLTLIEHIKKNKNWNNTITFQTLYDRCFESAPKGTEIARVRNHIKTMLDSWKRKGYIKDYKFNKEKNKFKSITIIV